MKCDGAEGGKSSVRRNRDQVRNGAFRQARLANRKQLRLGCREFRLGNEKGAMPANALHHSFGGRWREKNTAIVLRASYPRKRGGALLRRQRFDRLNDCEAGRLLPVRREKRNRIPGLWHCEESLRRPESIRRIRPSQQLARRDRGHPLVSDLAQWPRPWRWRAH